MTFDLSAGFLFQYFTPNLSFNHTFKIFLSKSFHNIFFTMFTSLPYPDNHSFTISLRQSFHTIFLLQSFFQNLSFSTFHLQSFYHSPFTIFLSQSFCHNISFTTFIFNLCNISDASLSAGGLASKLSIT